MIGIEDIPKCLLLGECKLREYEYYFYLNGEKIKADDCFSNLLGYSSCSYNGNSYKNVTYESVFVKEYIKKDNFPLLMPIVMLAISGFVWFIFKLIMGRN